MSRNQFRFEGLAEQRAAFRALPAHLTAEASASALTRGEAAAAAIRSRYPARAQGLAAGVSVTSATTGFSVEVTIRNTSPHAHLFEAGTQTRQTALGANRGAMPPGRVFVPIVVRERRAWYETDVKGLLMREGLTVSGDV